MAITKITGAVFRIPLGNLLGGTGMGYFSFAYGVFMPVYAVSITGLPTAVAKLTAENAAFDRFSNIRKIKRVSLTVFGTAGLALTLLIALLAYPFCTFVTDNPEAVPAVLCIAPSVFFGCITAVYRGYYEGMRNMYPTAVSQVAEGFTKLFAGLGFCLLVLNAAENEPYKLARIFHTSTESVRENALVYAAAVSILGVTVSTLAGMVFLIIRDKLQGKNTETDSGVKADLYTDRSKEIIKQLLVTVIPIAIGALVTNLTSLIDIATIIRSLKKAVTESPGMFSGYISESLPADELPNFIFGSFTGLAVTVFNLIPTFTNMFGKGVLPAVAEGFAQKDYKKVHKYCENVLFATAFIAVPAGLGISVMSGEILELLFPSKPLEVAVSEKSLAVLGIAVIFLSVSTTVFAVLQAAGRSDIPVKLMAAGVVIKLIGNIILVPLPYFGVNGAAVSTLACYMFIFIMSLYYFRRVTLIPSGRINALILKISFCGILCAVTAFLMKDLLINKFSNSISLVICIGSAVIIYIISTHLMGIFTKSTLKSLIY